MTSKQTDLFKVQTDNTANQNGEPQPSESNLLFEIIIPGKLPSWNEILGMEQWQRYKLKCALQETFLSALRHYGETHSTKTTSVKNTMSTASGTLALYMATALKRRELKQLKKKLEEMGLSVPSSKSSKEKSKSKKPDAKVPF